MGTGGDCGGVRVWEGGEGEEGRGDFMAEEGARRVAGKGEEEPDGFGEHSEGGGGEVHNSEATSAAREESNVLAGKEEGRERDFLLRSASGGCEARDRALHRDEVAVWVGREKAHLVHCFGGEALVRCVDAAGKGRVEVHPTKGAG